MISNAYLAGGCFWCVEHDLSELHGVVNAISGYATSQDDQSIPIYENHRGFREAVEIEYDTDKISFNKLIQFFLEHIDPTDTGGQFHDRGDSYKTAVYFQNNEEQAIAKSLLTELDESGVYDKPVVVDILPFNRFVPAEEYHQDYAKNNAVHYGLYRRGSGREDFVNKTCQIRIDKNINWK